MRSRVCYSLHLKKASVLRNGENVEVSIEEVRVDDLFLVHPGESIPVDGIVVEGNSAVNEASLTGESIPVDKTKGDTVSAATVNQSGVSDMQGSQNRRRYYIIADHPHGQRCGGNQSTDRKSSR